MIPHYGCRYCGALQPGTPRTCIQCGGVPEAQLGWLRHPDDPRRCPRCGSTSASADYPCGTCGEHPRAPIDRGWTTCTRCGLAGPCGCGAPRAPLDAGEAEWVRLSGARACHACGLEMGWVAHRCGACGADGTAALQAVLGLAHAVVDLAGPPHEGRARHPSLAIADRNPYRDVVAKEATVCGQAAVREGSPVPVDVAPGVPRCADCGEPLRVELVERGHGSTRCGCGFGLVTVPSEALAAYGGLRAALVEDGGTWVWLGGPSPLRRQLEGQALRAITRRPAAAPALGAWMHSLGVGVVIGAAGLEITGLWLGARHLIFAGTVAAVLGFLAVRHGRARL